jgi:hypothetical protein
MKMLGGKLNKAPTFSKNAGFLPLTSLVATGQLPLKQT